MYHDFNWHLAFAVGIGIRCYLYIQLFLHVSVGRGCCGRSTIRRCSISMKKTHERNAPESLLAQMQVLAIPNI